MAEEQSGGAIAMINQVAPENWRRKLGRIAFQLIAGSDGGVGIYAKAREHVDEIEAKATVTKMIAEAVGRQALSDPAVMERARARFLSEALREQENVEAVFEASLPHIEMNDAAPTDGEQEGLDQDWADAFARQAELASSDDLRKRLGRVLAGEINRRGTFPRSVIRTIAELEQPDLQAMQSIGGNVLEGLLYTFSGEPNAIPIERLISLSAEGLISDPGAALTVTKTIPPEGIVFFSGSEWALFIRGNPNQALSCSVLSLSKTGRAVIDLLGPFDQVPLLHAISDKFKGQVAETGLGKLIIDGDRLTMPLPTILHRAATQPGP